jgi:hypothetical protein
MTKPKPSTQFEVERIPLAMQDAPRWINWYPEYKPETEKKWTKIPCNARGTKIDATDAANGRTLRDVMQTRDASVGRTFAEHPIAATHENEAGLGIGFLLGDGWLGVDLDGVVDPASGKITNPDVEAWLAPTESYVETTPSKTGLHVIFKGVEIPEWSQNRRGFVEVYADKRFFTVTGDARFTDRDVLDDQAAIDKLCDKWLRKDKPRTPSPAGAKRKRNPDASADDFGFTCDLVLKGTPRDEIERQLRAKMIAEGRDKKANRPDYVPNTIDAAEHEVGSDPKRNVADKLVALAFDRFELGCTPKREPFAVERNGANVAIRLDGSAMKDTFADLYFDEHGRVAGSSAIEEALAVLRGKAKKTEPRELSLRYARHGDDVVVDLGRVDGKCIVVDREGWKIVDRSPVLFERSELVGELPLPDAGGSVEDLRGLLIVGDDDFDVLVGWMIAAMIPEIAHPILMLGGGHGGGKTTTARMIVGVLDESDAPTRTQPKDVETHALSVAASWTSVFDNISRISEWWSDALCKTVTGDAFTRRKLYSDRELSVVSFRRVVAITTIDAGALRGDLGDRLVLVDLETIDKRRNGSETAIRDQHKGMRPRILGAFCTLLSRVLRTLPTVHLEEMPRMADFARVLAALDEIRGTRSLATYLRQRERIADDVVQGDPVGSAVAEWLEETRGTIHTLTMKELRRALVAHDSEVAYRLPKTDSGLGQAMKRLAPALRLGGFEITQPRKTDKTRKWTLTTAQTAQTPESRTDDAKKGLDPRALPF